MINSLERKSVDQWGSEIVYAGSEFELIAIAKQLRSAQLRDDDKQVLRIVWDGAMQRLAAKSKCTPHNKPENIRVVENAFGLDTAFCKVCGGYIGRIRMVEPTKKPRRRTKPLKRKDTLIPEEDYY